MSKKPVSEKDRLTRMESTIAEIMRQNYPLVVSGDAGVMWLDVVEDLSQMFALGKPRFDSGAFFEACWGEQGR